MEEGRGSQKTSLETNIPSKFREFYADDGMMADTSGNRIHARLYTMVKVFKKIGLEFNETKSRWMICSNKKPEEI